MRRPSTTTCAGSPTAASTPPSRQATAARPQTRTATRPTRPPAPCRRRRPGWGLHTNHRAGQRGSPAGSVIDAHNHAVPETAIELVGSEPAYEARVEGGRWPGGVPVASDMPPSFPDPVAKVAELE